MTTERVNEAIHPDGHLSVLPRDECLELLETTTVGRVAFVNVDGIQLIPLNFAVIEGDIFFRTAPDSVLNELAAGLDDVVLEVDYHAEYYRDGWDITVKGSTIHVVDPEVYERVMSSPKLRPWAGGARGVIVQFVPRTIDGRRVSSHP